MEPPRLSTMPCWGPRGPGQARLQVVEEKGKSCPSLTPSFQGDFFPGCIRETDWGGLGVTAHLSAVCPTHPVPRRLWVNSNAHGDQLC